MKLPAKNDFEPVRRSGRIRQLKALNRLRRARAKLQPTAGAFIRCWMLSQPALYPGFLPL